MTYRNVIWLFGAGCLWYFALLLFLAFASRRMVRTNRRIIQMVRKKDLRDRRGGFFALGTAARGRGPEEDPVPKAKQPVGHNRPPITAATTNDLNRIGISTPMLRTRIDAKPYPNQDPIIGSTPA